MKIVAKSDSKVLELVGELLPDSSMSSRRQWIRQGRITVDGQAVLRPDHQVSPGQTISFSSKQNYLEDDLTILYEDRSLIVIDKPNGMLTVSTDFQTQRTAHWYLKQRYGNQNVHVVHRLDRETSGVMLFARSKQARDKLKKLFEYHDLTREYRAVVKGVPEKKLGFWKSFLVEESDYSVHSTEDRKRGRLAVTHYELLDQRGKYSMLKLTLETGRKHQIRVHCAEAGCPVLGDKRYGTKANPLKRMGLHAHRLAFTHPLTGKKLDIRSPVPKEFFELLGVPPDAITT